MSDLDRLEKLVDKLVGDTSSRGISRYGDAEPVVALSKYKALEQERDALLAVFEAAWALHHTAREQGGSLTVVGTAEYVALCETFKGVGDE